MAATAERTDIDWLARDQDFVDGLDHLGVQVVSINIYARLAPGISNLTDRARYFSFYAWVLDSFARLATDRSPDGWRLWVRRHEFALSAAGTAVERNGSIPAEAAGGLIGAIAGRRLIKSERVDLDAATRLDGGKAAKGTYFKNREGGYAQYYKGPMTALGILRVAEGRKAPDRQLTTYAGVKLAEAVDAAPGFDELSALAANAAEVSVSELAALGRIVHPGALDPESEEARLLRDLLLADDAGLCAGQPAHEGAQRRATFALVLDYVGQLDEDEWDSPVRGFRWAVLEEQLGDGRTWRPPGQLRACALAWAAYAQNELLNYALECLLWAALKALDLESPSPRALAAAMAEWARAAVPGNEDYSAHPALPRRLGDAVRAYAPPPPEECWERGGTWALEYELAGTDPADECVARAARLLLRVAADRERYRGRHPFATIPQGAEIAAAREVHLQAWWERVDAAHDDDTRAFFEQLVIEWVVYRHLRVATRKLAGQGDYTYRMRPEEGALVKCGNFEPVFTNPRLRQAIRMMADIGLVAHDLSALTRHGHALLGAFR